MNIIIDTHSHTIVSGHAYSTLTENIAYAKNIGLPALGITEHSFKMPGAPFWIYFTGLHNLPKIINGVRLYKGIELNIDCDGNLDNHGNNIDITKNLDYAIASLHSPTCPPDTSKKINTIRIIKAMENEKVKIIGHLGDPMFPFYIDEVLKKAVELEVAIEFNNSSLRPNHIRYNPDVFLEICKKANEFGNYITYGSDAHYHEDIGNFNNIHKLIDDNEIQLDESKILSTNIKNFENFIYK